MDGKPFNQWPRLGDYFASVRERDIRKGRQVRERGMIEQLVLDSQISAEEANAALHESDDLALALAGLQALVAQRQRAARRRGGE